MTPIYTQTVGSGGATSITFNNIPQTYTDLVLYISAKSNSTGFIQDWDATTFNGDTATNYSTTQCYGNNNNTWGGGGSNSTAAQIATFSTNFTNANFFSNCYVYIPNYRSSLFKQTLSRAVAEADEARFTAQMLVNQWRSTSAISSINIKTVYLSTGFVQNSTFSLYGILRQGV